MSPKLPRITASELLRALQRDGWQIVRQRGSHVMLEHPARAGFLVVPDLRGALRTGTLSSILQDAGLTSEQLRELL